MPSSQIIGTLLSCFIILSIIGSILIYMYSQDFEANMLISGIILIILALCSCFSIVRISLKN